MEPSGRPPIRDEIGDDPDAERRIPHRVIGDDQRLPDQGAKVEQVLQESPSLQAHQRLGDAAHPTPPSARENRQCQIAVHAAILARMSLQSLPRARALALELTPSADPEERSIEDALGLHLAQVIISPRDLPGCDNSAMDGYAVRSEETRGATRDGPVRLRVVDTVYAGSRPARALRPGEATRIFTGAPIPDGADAVVRQEAARGADGEVEIFVEAAPGQHIRRRGEELRRGATLFEEGQRIDAWVAGVIASVGIARVQVRPPPRVSVLAVGDELLEPGAPAEPHQIHDSNRIFLAALARDAGAVVVSTGRAPDDREALNRAITESLARCDVLITSGGASVGDRDLVKGVLRELGAERVVDGVALKPGKPVALARLGAKAIVVLPGNPGAAAVGFDQLARPLLLARQGAVELRRRTRVRLDGDRHKQAGLTYLLSARLEDRDGEAWARLRPQGAGQLLQNVGMDGWVELPPGRADFTHGEWVEMEHLAGAKWTSLSRVGGRTERVGVRVDPSRHRALSIIGWSGAGKTRLMKALIHELRARGLRVAAIKHSSHPHELHPAGSDTAALAEAGADPVAFITPRGVQVTTQDAHPLGTIERLSRSVDLVLVEGWKDGPLPKLEVRAPGAEPLAREGIQRIVDGPEPPAGAAWDELVAWVLQTTGHP